MSAADPVLEQPALIERLPFVEGLRGLAAFVVVAGHCASAGGAFSPPTSLFHAPLGSILAWPFWPGAEMVALFLMVSGFSLTYAEDRRRLSSAGATAGQFFRRRAWRILPTYYVALAFGLLVLALLPDATLDGSYALEPYPVTATGIGAHLVLVHNLDPAWIYQGNGPLWSMAYEAQLYALFGLLYVAMRHRSSLLVAIGVAAAAIVLDLARTQVAPGFALFGLLRWFALGMVVAAVYRRPAIQRLPVRPLLAVGLVALVVAYLRLPQLDASIPHDVIFGLAFTALLLAMSLRPRGRNPCSTRPLRWLGLRSYSLYALHFPVLWLVFAALGGLGLQGTTALGLTMFAVGLPLTVLVAEIGFRVVERPALARVRAVR